MINSTLLISDLKEVEITATKALEYFNSTRHIVLYYEDLIKNPTVSYDVKFSHKIHLVFYILKFTEKYLDHWNDSYFLTFLPFTS
jgi:hypothetical protein